MTIDLDQNTQRLIEQVLASVLLPHSVPTGCQSPSRSFESFTASGT